MDLVHAEITLHDGDGKNKTIELVHNVPNLADAIVNWQFRTDELTALSLAEYIRSKCLHVAMTVEEYEEEFDRKVSDDLKEGAGG